jgi:uncharacterized protein (TIGR01777 family)
MKIFLIGGTGFIGRLMVASFIEKGYEVTLLVSSNKKEEVFNQNLEVITGDPTLPGEWQKNMGTHDIVINLAGTSIFQRWNKRIKDEIYTSRITTTVNIVKGLKNYNKEIKHFFNASGVGYYGYHQEALFDEESPPGNSFLAMVARDWEQEALKAQALGVRTVLCRFGIVMGRGGGALKNMLPLFKMHCGGTWGNGKQWFTWIHESDVINGLYFLLHQKCIEGPVNFTAPHPVQNRELTECMRDVLQCKSILPAIPGVLIKLLLGEFSEVFLKGQRAIPGKLVDNGYTFYFSDLRECLIDLLRQSR